VVGLVYDLPGIDVDDAVRPWFRGDAPGRAEDARRGGLLLPVRVVPVGVVIVNVRGTPGSGIDGRDVLGAGRGLGAERSRLGRARRRRLRWLRRGRSENVDRLLQVGRGLCFD
jgi:hypothetical protein